MKLSIFNETIDMVVLEWDEEHCDKYIVQGLTDMFEYRTVLITTSCLTAVTKNPYIIGYKILGCVSDYIITYSNTVMVDSSSTMIPKIKELPSVDTPDGYAVSFRFEDDCDLYRVYDRDLNLISETKDPLMMTPSLQYCFINAYKNNELKAKIAPFIKDPVKRSKNPIELTIGIPVYNSGKFLIRTLSSILLSTYQDFEIVLVDDSTDTRTTEICEWYAKNFNFIRVIHRDGRGICSARNRAIAEAKGEWFAFVDADDMVTPYYFEKLMSAAKENNADIAIAQVVVREDFDRSSSLLSSVPVEKSFAEIMGKEKENIIYFCGVWNKVVKTEIARKVKFPEDREPYYEDISYTPAMYSYIDRFIYVPDVYYIWDKRKRKTVGTSSEEVNSIGNTLAWKLYILANAECLRQGNPDAKAKEIYTGFVYRTLLGKYKEVSEYKSIKELFEGILKRLFKEYKVSISALGDPNLEKLIPEIKASNAEEWGWPNLE